MQYRLAWPPLTRNVKATIITLGLFFVATVFVPALNDFVARYLLVSGPQVFEQGRVWTIFTYAFFHADFMHILFNGLMLWVFAGELDQRWSDKKFWGVSLGSALGGGVCIALAQWIFGAGTPTLGYSGAVMGLIAAYAWENWQRRINFFFFPMTGKTLLLVIIGFDLVSVLIAQEPISLSGHLGGMATGLLLAGDFLNPRKLKRRLQRRRMKKTFRDATREVDRRRNGTWIN